RPPGFCTWSLTTRRCGRSARRRSRLRKGSPVLSETHDAILRNGYATALLMGAEQVAAALEEFLEPDPRGPGKLHARDVIRWSVPDGGTPVPLTGSVDGLLAVEATESIAHRDLAGQVTDDFSRMPLTEKASGLAESVLSLIPPEARRHEGRMSA